MRKSHLIPTRKRNEDERMSLNGKICMPESRVDRIRENLKSSKIAQKVQNNA